MSRGVFVCERKRLVGCWAGSEESRRGRGEERAETRPDPDPGPGSAPGPDPGSVPAAAADTPTQRRQRTGGQPGEDGPAVARCSPARTSRMSVALQDLRNTVRDTHTRTPARAHMHAQIRTRSPARVTVTAHALRMLISCQSLRLISAELPACNHLPGDVTEQLDDVRSELDLLQQSLR